MPVFHPQMCKAIPVWPYFEPSKQGLTDHFFLGTPFFPKFFLLAKPNFPEIFFPVIFFPVIFVSRNFWPPCFFLAVRVCHTVGMYESICISGMAAVYNGFADEQTEVTPSSFFFILVQLHPQNYFQWILSPGAFPNGREIKLKLRLFLAHFIPAELHVAESMLVHALFQIF